MLNDIVRVFAAEVAKRTGQPPKPTKTGFAEYASNRIFLERAINKILLNINTQIAPEKQIVGNLLAKGDMYCTTNLKIQNGEFTNVNYKHLKSATKSPQKNVARRLGFIAKHIYSTELFDKISGLNGEEGIDNVNCISDLLQFYRHFELLGQEYVPSNGESSMLLLHRELMNDQEIYLIDEPEKSLGNDYISDVIVPLLKDKAKLKRKVIIATHDANIAVRTLPYNSIYRLHNANQMCFTFTGNPFSNNLKCQGGERPDLDWKEISMKTLEGGREAFGERGKIYGKN